MLRATKFDLKKRRVVVDVERLELPENDGSVLGGQLLVLTVVIQSARQLPLDGWANPSPGQWAAERFWQMSLHEGKKSILSFPMIGRLAELLLRVNPMARDALRLTYSHLIHG